MTKTQKNHSREGLKESLYVIKHSHVDFHKTFASIFSWLIQHLQYIENSFVNKVTRWV